VVHVDLRQDQAVVGGGGQQVRGVAVGVGGAADPFAIHREDYARLLVLAGALGRRGRYRQVRVDTGPPRQPLPDRRVQRGRVGTAIIDQTEPVQQVITLDRVRHHRPARAGGGWPPNAEPRTSMGE
jgi:hypothetical protein